MVYNLAHGSVDRENLNFCKLSSVNIPETAKKVDRDAISLRRPALRGQVNQSHGFTIWLDSLL